MPSATAAKPKLKLQMELFSEAKAHWAAPYRQVFCQVCGCVDVRVGSPCQKYSAEQQQILGWAAASCITDAFVAFV